jgi:ubiquinol-cytochrome c reductase iron-sulfur subunit
VDACWLRSDIPRVTGRTHRHAASKLCGHTHRQYCADIVLVLSLATSPPPFFGTTCRYFDDESLVAHQARVRHSDPNNRTFNYTMVGGARFLGASTARLLVVKFLAALNPAADVMALASLEVDVGNLTEGNCMIVKWRGKPVFVRARTAEEIAEAQEVNMGELRDPQSDDERVQKPETLVLIGVCTRKPPPPPPASCPPARTGCLLPCALRVCGTHHHPPHSPSLPSVSAPRSRAQTSAACRSTAPVTSTAGSARATARTTTPRDAFARGPRPSTWRSRPISSSTTPRSSLVRRVYRERRPTSRRGCGRESTLSAGQQPTECKWGRIRALWAADYAVWRPWCDLFVLAPLAVMSARVACASAPTVGA